MRSQKQKNYIGEIRSSFLSCEKDLEAITKILFARDDGYSDDLKRLLCISNNDCLADKTNPIYIEKINKISIGTLFDEGYVGYTPDILLGENEEIKNYIIFTFENFHPSETNPYYTDAKLMIDVICNSRNWMLKNYQLRVFKILGIIDGLLNGVKLSGIGTLKLTDCSRIVLNSELQGYCMTFESVHGNDDTLEAEDE